MAENINKDGAFVPMNENEAPEENRNDVSTQEEVPAETEAAAEETAAPAEEEENQAEAQEEEAPANAEADGEEAGNSESEAPQDEEKKEGGKENARRAARRRRLALHFANKRDLYRVSRERPERVMSKRKQAAAKLLNAKTQNQPMPVTVTGLEPMKKKDGSFEDQPVAEYYGWKIIIPRGDYIPSYVMRNIDEDEVENRENRYLFSAIGTEVDIIPKGFIPEQHICIASRLDAMEVRKEQYWFGVNTRTDHGEQVTEYALKPGVVAEARVVNVSKAAVFVEVFGVETVIRAPEVSYIRLENCKAKFRPGQKVRVRIKTVDRDEQTGDVRFEASIKDAYPDPRKEDFVKFKRGGKYGGTVSMIQTRPGTDARSGAFVKLDHATIDVFCSYPKVVLPQIGDHVTIEIVNKDENTLRLWGVIRHVDLQYDENEDRTLY